MEAITEYTPIAVREIPDGSKYEAFSHRTVIDGNPRRCYGIRISANRELAVQTDITPDRSGILSFLELLSGNAAIPMELHALAEDFLTDQYLPGKGRNDPQHNH